MRGPTLPARFEIQSLLGAGGGGRVYRVFDRTLERDIALKIVGASEAAWLRREFDVLRHIRHENLVRVLTCSSLPTGECYYTMELVDGPDWGTLMGEPQRPKEVLRILTGVLRGLGHLHCHREVHGDLKPGNVLLGLGGAIKLADVGMGMEQGSPSASMRTPGYTAPEVWTGGTAHERSDIYSAGVIAYEALTGRHPFGALTVREVISGQLDGWVPSPSVHRLDIPSQLERAIMRSLEREPELRQASADEFLEAIGASNPGEILAGRFVNRTAELNQLSAFLTSDEPGSKTMLHISGPSGVGKTALLEQAIPRLVDEDWHICDFSCPEEDLKGVIGDLVRSQATASEPLSGIASIADRLISRFQSRKVLLIEDSLLLPEELTRNLARYIWAEATERNVPAMIRIVRAVPDSPATLEPFEALVRLTPFRALDAGGLVTGVLGTVELDDHFVDRLVSETGGIPRLICTATLELIDRKFITRRFGRWAITQPPDADWRSLKATTSRWARSWERLGQDEKDVLTAIVLAREGATVANIGSVLPRMDTNRVIARLVETWWIALHGQQLRLQSREAARIVAGVDNASRLNQLRPLLLRALVGRLSRADRAALMVECSPSNDTVREGMWLGVDQRMRGQQGEAVATFFRVRDAARALNDHNSAREAALEAGSDLLQAGANEEVIAVLNEGSEWDRVGQNEAADAGRSRLLGLAHRSLGELDAARAHFVHCSDVARGSRNTRLWLQAEAEIAEIMWRHGGEPGRSAAVDRIMRILGMVEDAERHGDEWSALQYQLGACLVVEGKRTEAIRVLDGALKLTGSTYWHMRINNALATAHYYLGDFQAALAAADIAWECAIHGGVDSFKPRILATRAGIRFGLGLFREASEQNQLAAFWGRRIGSPFEYAAGLLGATSDLIQLADYERAIQMAVEARKVVSGINQRDFLKSFEMEGLAHLQAGDNESAAQLFSETRRALVESGSRSKDLVARLNWHEARIDIERGMYGVAEERLDEARRILEETMDWEDLPGVRIEMQSLYARMRDPRASADVLVEIAMDAHRKEVAIVHLRATLALGETSSYYGQEVLHLESLLLRGLQVAERSGADEFVWRLSYLIAMVFRKRGDVRAASTRLANAIRVMREVTGRLSPRHRETYLNTVHARQLLSEAGLVTDSGRSQQRS